MWEQGQKGHLSLLAASLAHVSERDLLQGNKVESERVRLDTLLWLIHHTHTACAHTEMHINTHTKEGTALTQQVR